jgi:hypothetical protein
MAAFTTIAAGVALTATVGSTAMSFSNASKQGKLAAQAKADADASMQKARQALEINYQKEQAVKKEPFELEREAALSAGAEAIQAGVESGQAAPTAGRVMLAQQGQQANIQQRMGQEMTAIDKSIINESSRLRDIGVQMDLGEAEGAQLAARDAEEAKAKATAEGWQGVTSAVGQAASFVPLFGQNIGAQKSAVGKMSMSNEDFQKFGNVGGKSMGAAGADGFTNLDLGSVANMSNSQFRQFKRDLSPEQSRMLFQNDQYTNNYNPNPFRY